MNTRPFIEITLRENGVISTVYRPAIGHDPVFIGIALASATRVITEAFRQELILGPEHQEQIEAAIAATYNRDLGFGDMGESETTHLQEGSPE